MIDIVIPCMVEHSNNLELVTIGSCNLSWSPNWSNLFTTNNKVLIYDIISDNSLNDSEVLIDVGHTNIKLNDLKFLFKLNGIHSNCKLYYDAAIVNKLIKFSIPANMFMAMIDYCEENEITGLFTKVSEDYYSVDCVHNDVTNSGKVVPEKLLKFFRKFLSLSLRDELNYSIKFDSENVAEAKLAHLNYNLNLSKKSNKVKEASRLLCDKLINLLQLDRKAYEQVSGQPIPAGSMAYIPNRPNFLRSTCFLYKGATEEQVIQGFTSGIIFFKCPVPITSSFFLYSKENKIVISNATTAFRPEPYGTKDPRLFSQIDADTRREMHDKKLFDEVELSLDLLNKALKAFVAGDLLYFYAITGIIFKLDVGHSVGDLIVHDLDEDLLKIIGSYDSLSIALGGIKSDDNKLILS